MNKLWMILPCCFLYSIVSAQSVNEVVSAERAFAQHAVTHSVKQAFLKYLDSNGVVFNEGEILNGIQSWHSAPEGNGKLLWYPAYAAIAAQGDLGFTTGPFEFRKTLTDSVLTAGQYTTVWTKTAKGQWRFLVDLGVSYQPSLYNKQPFLEYVPAGAADTSVMTLEHDFIRNYKAHSLAAFGEVITDASWFNIHQQAPLHNKQDIMQALQAVPANLEFIPVASGMAKSKDLAYAYGIVQYKGRKENYLRIWAHTPEGWKVLVQVLRW